MRRLTKLLLTTVLLLACPHLTAQCTVTEYGTGCGGLAAVGSAEPNGNTVRVTFSAIHAAPGAAILFLVGGPEASVSIPGTRCLLLLEPVFAQNHVAGHDGTYTFSKALPSTFAGRARVQFGEVVLDGNAIRVRMTNGLLLDCTP